MSAGSVASHDALALALAFFKAPGRFPDLLHGRAPLPSGMTELLQVAAGDLPEGAAPPMFVSLPELREAALFFIDQVLLARDADHYRVMGLAAGADADQIKEHHRLLMRMFHPDRLAAPNERAEEAAARINRGYAVLRGAETRAAYFETVQPAASIASKSAAYPTPVRVASQPPGPSLPPALRRHAPQIVLGAVAVVAIGAVAMVYVNRVPHGAIGAGALVEAPRGDDVVGRADAMVARGDAVASRGGGEATPEPGRPVEAAGQVDLLPPAARSAEAMPTVPAGERPQASLAKAGTPVAEVTAPALSPEPVRAASQPRETAAASGERIASATASVERSAPATVPVERPAPPSTASAQPMASSRSEPPREEAPARAKPPVAPVIEQATAATPVAVAAATGAAPTAAESNTEPPTAVLQRFVAAYERGDLEGLMALFDEDARIERGGRARIRRDYAELFRGSEMRSLRLSGLRWSGEGETMRGEGAFIARVVRRGEEGMRNVAGSIRVELVKRGDRLLIISLYHSAG